MPQLSIGVFASRSGLSVSALRFYDRAGLLIPAEVDLAEMTGRVREAEHLATHLRARLTEAEGSTPMTTMIVDASALTEAIDQVAPAASTDPEFPLLHTVLIEAREGSLRLVATDRYRLAVRELVARGGEGASFRAVVARAALERVRATLADEGQVEVTMQDGAVVVGADHAAGRMPAMPTEFPPYEKLLVLDPDADSAIADRIALTELFADALGQDALRLRLLRGRLQLDVDGEPPRELAVTYEGRERTVALNPAFAHYAVATAVGPDVMIDITEAIRPVVFRSATDSSYVCLVMPVKLR